MFVLARALTYAALFIALFFVLLPSRLLQSTGLTPRAPNGPLTWLGAAVATAGLALALWCVLTFAGTGRGTPAPFDPPRRLVASGPYRFVRNPMYLGGGLALGGAALCWRSVALAAYAAGFLFAAHLYVCLYEELHLRRKFGADYEAYRGSVGRWWPRRGTWRRPPPALE